MDYRYDICEGLAAITMYLVMASPLGVTIIAATIGAVQGIGDGIRTTWQKYYE